MSNTELANKILDFLNDRPYDIKTPKIVSGVGLPDTDPNRTRFRQILDMLRTAGHVTKKGVGQFKWRLTPETNVNGWDRSAPFSNSRPGYTPPEEPTSDPEDDDERPSPTIEEKPTPSTGDYVTRKEFGGWTKIVADTDERLRERIKVLEADIEAKETRLDKLEKLAAAASQHVKILKIERYDGKVFKIKDLVLPAYFQDILDLAQMRQHILLVGPAGCGKSTVAEMTAKALGLKFGKVGGSGGLSETHLLGGKDHNLMKGTSTWRSTEFVERYEQGGVMLVDELDAADPNVLLALNPALDKSGVLPLPNRGTPAKKHKDFICIATANTVGRGATRIYAGRNQLDGATLNRFPVGIIECYYDEAVERAVCPDDELREKIQTIRRKMEEAMVRQIISTRHLESAYVMQEGKGWKWDKIQQQIFQGWTRDEINKVTAA